MLYLTKDGLEDLKRHRADNHVNCSPTYTLSNWINTNFEKLKHSKDQKKVNFGKGRNKKKWPSKISSLDYIERDINATQAPEDPTTWLLTKWQDVLGKKIINSVGDFVLLRNNENIPADIVILSTSEKSSTCYVETKNLDGETNLKIKKGLADLEHLKSPHDCKNVRGYIEIEAPNPNLYTFNGAMTLIDPQSEKKTIIPIGPNGILLRGCMLRNTTWLIGIVVYTGQDSKIMMNSGPTPTKRSKVERQINAQVKSINQGFH
jgi:phospholipid-translocating ATPase